MTTTNAVFINGDENGPLFPPEKARSWQPGFFSFLLFGQKIKNPL
jgi:hypothetical protein